MAERKDEKEGKNKARRVLWNEKEGKQPRKTITNEKASLQAKVHVGAFMYLPYAGIFSSRIIRR